MKKALYHKELDVWRKSMDLVTAVYEITAKFPKEEIYCLTNQIRRSAISIPANIAEGSARRSQKEFLQRGYSPTPRRGVDYGKI
jgi:four helix bundle protein